MISAGTGMDGPAPVARLDAGPVEYRLEQRGDAVVIVFHGGHERAESALGQDVFAEADYTVLAPSRPGYGRTPLSTGTSVSGFADVTRALCERLGITQVAAVVGVSAGGPTAVMMAARHPDVVQRLILQSAVGWLPYPGRGKRLGSQVMFAAATERVTWGAIRALMHLAPGMGLRLILGELSTHPRRHVMAALRPQDRVWLVNQFSHMRSGSGFRNDLRATPDVTAQVGQPTLVIATRTDGGVPFTHAQSLTATIGHAKLIESQADTHFIWLGPDWPAIAETIRAFLATDLPKQSPAAAGG